MNSMSTEGASSISRARGILVRFAVEVLLRMFSSSNKLVLWWCSYGGSDKGILKIPSVLVCLYGGRVTL